MIAVYFLYGKKYNFLNKLYNHILKINIHNSFYSNSKKDDLTEKAKLSLYHLLKPTNESEIINKEIPKIIWFYWSSGFENAPDVVRKSVDSWRNLNLDYQVNLLCDDNFNDYLDFMMHFIYPQFTAFLQLNLTYLDYIY
ncbi:capsular polysaccharide synthesis protein [Vibrio rumoiensis]|uniref:capsular polysaccharide synthesis protein n=1 Tax=Vibrio rumoiensis TaxID=76258 RepID=UPI003AA8BAE8